MKSKTYTWQCISPEPMLVHNKNFRKKDILVRDATLSKYFLPAFSTEVYSKQKGKKLFLSCYPFKQRAAYVMSIFILFKHKSFNMDSQVKANVISKCWHHTKAKTNANSGCSVLSLLYLILKGNQCPGI